MCEHGLLELLLAETNSTFELALATSRSAQDHVAPTISPFLRLLGALDHGLGVREGGDDFGAMRAFDVQEV
jgi:hypothetical protein